MHGQTSKHTCCPANDSWSCGRQTSTPCFAGGSITPDTELNSSLYGSSGQNMSPREIVDGTAAAEDRAQPALLPVYKLLQQIQASAKDDPR